MILIFVVLLAFKVVFECVDKFSGIEKSLIFLATAR